MIRTRYSRHLRRFRKVKNNLNSLKYTIVAAQSWMWNSITLRKLLRNFLYLMIGSKDML